MQSGMDDDRVIEAALDDVSPRARGRLAEAVEETREAVAAGRVLATWTDGSGVGTPADPGVVPYPEYDEIVSELLEALEDVDAVPTFDWMRWDGRARYADAESLRDAPLADAMRLVTCIIRGERFGDGVIAAAIAKGTLLCAAERILDSL